MGLTDKLSEGLQTVATGAQKVFEQGKVRVEQLQLERQLDSAARRLGYIEFDFSQGRPIDAAARRDLLDEMARMEGELHEGFTGSASGAEAASSDAGAGMGEAAGQAEAAAGVRPEGDGPSAPAAEPEARRYPPLGPTEPEGRRYPPLGPQ
jgi:hypothetical protein